MKQKELNRLGHFMMMQTAQNTAEIQQLVREIQDQTDMPDKDKVELYEQIIAGSVSNAKNIASIMTAATDSHTFRFKRKNMLDMTILDVANALGVKLECNCETKEKVSEPKKDDFSVTEVKIPQAAKDELMGIFMSVIEKNKGKK